VDISELIEDLKAVMAERGDIEVVNPDGEAPSLTYDPDDGDQTEALVIE
jgi:hypothetical protein